MQQRSDEQLVALVLNGEQEAFSILVERYQKQIFSLACKLGGDYEEARDMAQECFLRVYQELPRFDASRRFFPWMYRVAHNTCVNLLKKRPKEQVADEDVLLLQRDELAPSPGEGLEQREAAAELLAKLDSLPESYREPLLLRYTRQMSYQDIAAELGLPVSTVETRLFRARRMLKELLDKRE